MRVMLLRAGLMLVALMSVPGLVLSQAGQQNGTLLVSGQPGQAPVLQMNGRSYVDIEALARLANGSLKFNGNQIILTLPASAGSTPTTDTPASPAANPGFSKEFMKAGIEEMTVIREWRSALVNAVQNGFPLTDDIVARFRGQAIASDALTSAAASTDSDQNAYQLVSKVLDKTQKLSDKVVAARKNLNYISGETLKNDPLFQQILNCTHTLASMAASGQFQDDGSCH
jgi:hypothetical protein